MNSLAKTVLLCLLLMIVTVIPATAQLATLAWDQNTQPEVVGYRVYYQTDSPTFPFNGTTLVEGTSPVTINGATNTSLTVNLPDDGKIYYFTATSVSASGFESTFSDIIASEWIPLLLYPANITTNNSMVTFSWDLPPSGYNVTYKLYYGTDPNLNSAVAPVGSSGSIASGWPQVDMSMAIPLAILFSILLAIFSALSNRIWRPIRIGVCIGIVALQVSCSSGGETGSGAPADPLFTNVVSGITTTSYQVTDLQPGTQYYWKIVAVDDQGFPFESLKKTFATN